MVRVVQVFNLRSSYLHSLSMGSWGWGVSLGGIDKPASVVVMADGGVQGNWCWLLW